MENGGDFILKVIKSKNVKKQFGLFIDSSPDRWGRMLMERREAIISRKTGEPKKSLAESDFFNDEAAQKWLKMLMAPGTSLGGARPKANVIDPSSHLWIAKFPSKNDDNGSGAWELIVNKMANKMNISNREQTMMETAFER